MKEENKYKVNPEAENVCSALATLVLWIFIIGAAALIVLGIISIENLEEETGITCIVSAIVCLAVGVITWASMKMLVNISRNLYNINDAIRSQHSKEGEIDE